MLKTERSVYLLNIVFLFGLGLLLINDHYLKGAYGNWLTGKLSDFAGVLILPLFVAYLTGWRKTVSVGLTLLLFGWWKSPWSSSAIELFNLYAPVNYARVIDYTDLVALTILPLSVWVLRKPNDFAVGVNWRTGRILTSLVVFPMALFSFVATSVDENFNFRGPVLDCCLQEPIDTLIGTGYVYIPTAVSHNGDGRNDVFRVFTDDKIQLIDSVRIYSRPDSFLLFSADSLTSMNDDNGWQPTDFDFSENEPFSVLIDVAVTAEDGTRARLRNVLCGMVCPAENGNDEEFDGPGFPGNCTFGSQLDANGRFDRTIDSREDLSCL